MKIKALILLLLMAGQYTRAQNLDISGFARSYEGVLFNTGDFGFVF